MPDDRKIILLVEDNPDDEALSLRAFRRNNIIADVILARDGREALQCLHLENDTPPESLSPLPHVILLDIKLPHLDGLEVLRRIRAHTRTAHLPVVILTSSLDTGDMKTAYQYHASSYLRKPVDFTEFIEMIGIIGRYWLELNHLPYVSAGSVE